MSWFIYQWKTKTGKTVDSSFYSTAAEARLALAKHAEFASIPRSTPIIEVSDHYRPNFGHEPLEPRDVERMLPSKDYVFSVIHDVVADFVYYDRKGDEVFSADDLQKMVKTGAITVDEMVEAFREQLVDNFTETT